MKKTNQDTVQGKAANLPAFFSYRSLGKRWEKSVVTLRRWVASGKLKACWIGGTRRFELAEVLRIEAEGRTA